MLLLNGTYSYGHNVMLAFSLSAYLSTFGLGKMAFTCYVRLRPSSLDLLTNERGRRTRKVA